MTESVVNFPSQAVSDLEKLSHDYGLEIAKAIKQEWFEGVTSKFDGNINDYHSLRLYARGEQPIQKYKNELSINGDLDFFGFGLYKCLLQAIIAKPELIDASCFVLLFISNFDQSLRVSLKYIAP